MKENKQGTVLNFKVSEHLKAEILKAADKKGLAPGTFIKAVIKKYIKYKEPEIV